MIDTKQHDKEIGLKDIPRHTAWVAISAISWMLALYVGAVVLGLMVTVLPWLIGIGWMAHHWLGV